MKKISNSVIAHACEALKKAEIVNDGKYKKVFKGYISSFGASVAQTGLLPTLIFFENKSEQAEDRPKVVDALKVLLPEKYQVESLARYLLEHKNEKEPVKEVTDAMISMKLALRLYGEEDK